MTYDEMKKFIFDSKLRFDGRISPFLDKVPQQIRIQELVNYFWLLTEDLFLQPYHGIDKEMHDKEIQKMNEAGSLIKDIAAEIYLAMTGIHVKDACNEY